MKKIAAIILIISLAFSSEKVKLCWDMASFLDLCHGAGNFLNCDEVASAAWLSFYKSFKNSDLADAIKVICFTACISPKSVYKDFKADFVAKCLEEVLKN